MKNSRIFTMSIIALMAAVMCVIGPNSIALPFSPVPVSLTNLVIFFAAYILVPARCTVCVVIYILLGLSGVPVFSGYSGGFSKIAGPTGGYLIGFIFMAYIASVFVWKSHGKIWFQVLGMLLALLCTYFFGSIWFCLIYEADIMAALWMCVIPYIPMDIVKIIIAITAGNSVRKRLIQSNLI